MTVLALDQSSRVSGWSVFEDNKLLTFGSFDCEDDDIGQRLFKVRKNVKELIDKYKPSHIVFEDIQLQDNVGNNVQTFKILAEVYGVISELLTELKIPYTIMLAGTWKNILEIEGRTRPEQKKNAQRYVKNRYKIDVIQDIADSICIGTAYLEGKRSAWD